jgi:hypothetical protein
MARGLRRSSLAVAGSSRPKNSTSSSPGASDACASGEGRKGVLLDILELMGAVPIGSGMGMTIEDEEIAEP